MGVLFPVWIMYLHQAEKTENDSAVGSLCSDSKFSEGDREAQPQTCSWVRLLSFSGLQRPGEEPGVEAELQGLLESLPGTLDPRALWSVPPSL